MDEQSLDEIRLAYTSHADMQFVLRKLDLMILERNHQERYRRRAEMQLQIARAALQSISTMHTPAAYEADDALEKMAAPPPERGQRQEGEQC